MSWTKEHREANTKRLRKQYEEKLGYYSITKEKIAKLYYEDKLSVDTICAMFPGANIWKFMDENKMPRRAMPECFHVTKMRQLREKGITEELLRELYINQKLSTRAIDEKLGCMAAYYLRYFDIPMRKNTAHNSYRVRTEEEKKKQSIAAIQRFSNPEERNKVSIKKLELIASGWKPNVEAAHKRTRELWANPEYKRKRIGTFLRLVRDKPNKSELQLGKIIDEACPSEYEYTGNGKIQLKVDGKTFIPDFTHKSKRKVIEFFGDYWHSAEVTGCRFTASEPGKIDAYHSIDYDCLIIWEHNLMNKSEDEIIELIRQFNIRELEPYVPMPFEIITVEV